MPATIAPSVLFAIGQFFQRRSEGSPSRIIGALLSKTDSGTVNPHVCQCFVVPHSEVGDQISINIEYYKQLSELQSKAYCKKLTVVGWFSVFYETAEISAKNTEFINDSFCKEILSHGIFNECLHLSLILSPNGSAQYRMKTTDLAHRAFVEADGSALLLQSNEVFTSIFILNKHLLILF